MDTANRHGSARTARRLVGPILVLPVLALSLRCEPFRGGDEPSPVPGSDADARSDGSATDGDSGAADAESDAGKVNLLANPGFEESLGDCGGWNAGSGTAIRSDDARTGSWSCLICPAPPSIAQFYLAAPPVNLQGRSTYVAEAWFKTADSGPPATLVGVTVAVPGQDKLFANQVTLTDTWTRSSTAVPVLNDGTVDFQIFVFVPNGGCVLVDDASLHRQP